MNDLGALSGALEYNGNYGTRFGRAAVHLLKGQLSYSPLPCLEIGPTLQAQCSPPAARPMASTSGSSAAP